MLRFGSCVRWLSLALGRVFSVGWGRVRERERRREDGAFGVLKATAKCDQHCELHDSVNHLKVERMLLFRVILESIFSYGEGGIDV